MENQAYLIKKKKEMRQKSPIRGDILVISKIILQGWEGLLVMLQRI
jgi:hypothetical protein